MRDVIIVGAGAGGPVVAAELAGRGLDVLLLEAGAHATRPGEVWSHFEDDANNPLTGYFRFGPSARSERAWFRELPQNSFIWQSAGVGGTTLHYYGNCPRPIPVRSPATTSRIRAPTTRRTCSPSPTAS